MWFYVILHVSSRCDACSVHEFPQFLATGKTGRFPRSKFRIVFAQKVSGFRTRRFEALNLMPGLCCWMYESDKRSKRFLRSWCRCHVVAPLLPLIAQRSNFMFCLRGSYSNDRLTRHIVFDFLPIQLWIATSDPVDSRRHHRPTHKHNNLTPQRKPIVLKKWHDFGVKLWICYALS